MTTEINPSPKRKLSLKTFVALGGIFLLVIWGLFHRSVSNVVDERFSGQLFELPTAVYSRALTLTIDAPISKQQLLDELKGLNYQQVNSPANSGEYSITSDSVTLVRRAFEFDDGFRDLQRVRISFSKSRVRNIVDIDNGETLGLFQIEPQLMGMLSDTGEQHRLYQSWQDMPEALIKALLLTEDRAFFEHDGISLTAIARAFLTNMKAGRTVQGGSTLTQQLTKNLFLTSERSLSRKLREAYMAVLIDSRFSKDEILDGYVNQIYLAQQGSDAIHGFELGAQFYFNKPLQELRVDQLALLVGVVKGPSYYNPWRFPERVTNRRNTILKLLEEDGFLEASEYEAAIARNLDLQVRGRVTTSRPAYFDLVAQELAMLLPNQSIQGARVLTTLDPISQLEVEKSIVKTLPALDAIAGAELEVAMLAVDYRDGSIRAIVGNRNPRFAGYNFAKQGSRQVGSIIKPAIFLAALEEPERFNLATTLKDQPLTLTLPNGDTWQPRNYTRQYKGLVPLYSALADSLNVPTVNLGIEIGLDKVAKTIEQLGDLEDSITPLPSILLGAVEMTPMTVSQLYQPIANKGERQTLFMVSAVMDSNNNQLYQHYSTPNQVAREQAADLTLAGLQATVTEGTGKNLGNIGKNNHLAGKTGTTNNGRDSWYVGVDGKELVTVWVGRGDNGSTKLTGSSGALRVYRDYVEQRKPSKLEINFAEDVKNISYRARDDGSLRTSCGRGNIDLPIWGADENVSSGCAGEEIGNFFKRLFTM
ncbi:penicillin-binding protein 1B [Vibrio astriarenae]|uniref:penicillin-binding protein 1B n=1 Tax=Vibrio astriarenae TaxID=1481923 RepID=UPI003734DED3